MTQFTLPGTLTLVLEPVDKKLRLVLSNGTNELACRKETRANLKRFITSTETRLFKGRLQLRKNVDAIMITLKGDDVGMISLEELEKALEPYADAEASPKRRSPHEISSPKERT